MDLIILLDKILSHEKISFIQDIVKESILLYDRIRIYINSDACYHLEKLISIFLHSFQRKNDNNFEKINLIINKDEFNALGLSNVSAGINNSDKNKQIQFLTDNDFTHKFLKDSTSEAGRFFKF